MSNKKERQEGGCLTTACMWAFIFVFGMACAFLFSSCKTKYVAVPEYHNVYVEKRDTLTRVDSIYEKDSVLVMISGDTVTTYKTKILYRDRWREKIVYRDSVKTDSIRVPYPVEKPVSKWQRAKDSVLLVLLAMVAALVAVVKFRKP